MEKPYSPACDRNKDPILKILKENFTGDRQSLLEIGSGTGQHAVYFAPHFKNITWTTSDRMENHPGIKSWLRESKLPNIKGPLEFEIGKTPFPKGSFDLVFTANTLHIMSWKEVKSLIKLLGENLREGSQIYIYGPFNYNGEYTSDSNAQFDQMLKEKNPKSGIRNFEDLKANMEKRDFQLTNDYEMPANNRLIIMTKISKK